MAAEPLVLDELRRLRARVPQLTGALAAGVDGLVLAQDTPGVEPENVAALTATALGVAVRIADATGQGDFRELLVRGMYGYVATYAAGRSTVLTVFAQDRVNVGRLHLEGRRAGARIGELVDAELARTQAQLPSQAQSPAQPPPPSPAQPPARSAARHPGPLPGALPAPPQPPAPGPLPGAPPRRASRSHAGAPAQEPPDEPRTPPPEATAQAAPARTRTARTPRTTPTNARSTTES